MQSVLTTHLELPLSREEVFPFFASAENLERITPPELRFEIVTPRPIVIREGSLLDYRLQLFGVRFGWRTRIRQWRPPHGFIDEQLKGPYRLWVHHHTFEEIPGGTLIRDRVEYALPAPPIGELGRPLVRWELRRIFTYRQRRVIQELMGSDADVPWGVQV